LRFPHADDYIRAVARPLARPTAVQLVAMLVLATAAGGAAALGFAAKPAPTPRKPPPYRYLFHTGPDQRGAASLGFNLLDVDEKAEADGLPRGARGLYWLGDYLNAPTCDWEKSDSAIAAKVRAAKGDAKVWGYYFSNEPDPYGCPNAIAQHRARAALIKSIDPTKTTLVGLNANGERTRSYWHLWSTPLDADVLAIDPYPCMIGEACDWSLVTDSILAANVRGFRYWFVVESFQNYEYRYPTADELRYLIGLMRTSNAEGLMTFAWNYDGHCLCDHPDLLSVWSAYNHS
jgi:hypothetical protein